MDHLCNEAIVLWNGKVEYRCVLPEGHDGDRHYNEDGDSWEDWDPDSFLFVDEIFIV